MTSRGRTAAGCFPADMRTQAEAALTALRTHGHVAATAESCTGGMIAAALTSVAGSSDVFDRGFVTYSNAAKTALLGVPAGLIEQVGAVSAEVAMAMVEGCLNASDASLAVSVTGVAGPGGGTPEKPVGLVFIGCGLSGQDVEVRRYVFAGDRDAVRHASVNAALDLVLQVLNGTVGPRLP